MNMTLFARSASALTLLAMAVLVAGSVAFLTRAGPQGGERCC